MKNVKHEIFNEDENIFDTFFTTQEQSHIVFAHVATKQKNNPTMIVSVKCSFTCAEAESDTDEGLQEILDECW